MTLSMKARLSAMMFLEYFIWGGWYVTFGTWLSASLHLTGQRIGVAAGTTAVGAIVAPFLVGLIADKFSARSGYWPRCISPEHFCCLRLRAPVASAPSM